MSNKIRVKDEDIKKLSLPRKDFLSALFSYTGQNQAPKYQSNPSWSGRNGKVRTQGM